jgi:hypothetical protein
VVLFVLLAVHFDKLIELIVELELVVLVVDVVGLVDNPMLAVVVQLLSIVLVV